MTGVLIPSLAAGLPFPDELDIHVWDSADELPSDDVLRQVEYYVMPYTFSEDTGQIIARLPSLSVVQTLTAGYEHVLPYLREGITLCNARGVHDASTAELAVTLTLASLRGVPGFVKARERGEWAFGWYESLADKTVLIVGYGAIGRAIEARLVPFECDILRVARTARDGVQQPVRTARDGVAGFESLPDLIGHSDVIILICPLTDETRRMVDAKFLASMRDGALLVNVSRGGVVDTDALVAELATGRLRAAVDVTDPEPPPSGHSLWTVPGLLMSPHVGGSSSAFEPRARRLVRAQLRRYSAGEPLVNVVIGADPQDEET